MHTRKTLRRKQRRQLRELLFSDFVFATTSSIYNLPSCSLHTPNYCQGTFLPKYAKFSTTLTMPTLRNKRNVAFKSISILRKEDICLEQFMNGTWYNMHNTYTMHIFYSNLSLLSQKKNLSAKRAGMVTSFFLQFMIVLAEYTFRKIEIRHFYRFFVSR